MLKVGRRRRRHPHRTGWVVLLAACTLLLLSLVVRLHPPGASQNQNVARDPWPSQFLAPLAQGHTRARLVYPYSVIPGGVESARELKEAIARDPVVADHYRDFNVSTSRVVRLKSARMAYVSYRVGDRIFWTRRKLRLGAGERVLTDGRHYARARCGNRISPFAQKNTAPEEPPHQSLNTPLPQLTLPFQQPIETVELTPVLPVQPILAPASSSSPLAFAPPVPPLYLGIGLPAPALPRKPRPKNGPGKRPAPPPEVPAVPEPGTFVLMVSGAACVAYKLKARKRPDPGSSWPHDAG